MALFKKYEHINLEKNNHIITSEKTSHESNNLKEINDAIETSEDNSLLSLSEKKDDGEEIGDSYSGATDDVLNEEGLINSKIDEEKTSSNQIIKTKYKTKIKKAGYYIICALLVFFFLFPTVFTIIGSFESSSEVISDYGMLMGNKENASGYVKNYAKIKMIPEKITLKQYFILLIKTPDYLYKYWNSVIYTVPIVVFQIIISLGASYSFARNKGKIRDALMIVYIVICLLPYQVTTVPNFIVLNEFNLLDTNWAIWLPGITNPFAVYLLTKYMRGISEELYEAARVDGASEWQVFRSICLPLCKRAVTSVAILIFIDYWNMIEQPIMMLDSQFKYPLSTFISSVNEGEISLAFAAASIYMILPLLIFIYGKEYLADGVACQSGIKG